MITVQIAKNFDIKVDLPKLKKLVKAVCSRFKLKDVTVSIAIVGDEEITRLNKQFLGRDHTTDCLSFDLPDHNTSSQKLFELVVNAQMALKQTESRNHTPQAELALYISHCLLHNLGFDDSTPKKAKKMHDTEDEILQQTGFGTVYNT
jgi:probable rRNA maturation factor